MRFGHTHDILTGYAMPNTKKKRIREINHEIDSPSPGYREFKKRLGLNNSTYNRFPGINYKNHRSKGGHDFSDAIYLTAKYGQEGFEAYLNHLGWDMISDSWVKNYGSWSRNMAEDTFLELSRPKYRKPRYF